MSFWTDVVCNVSTSNLFSLMCHKIMVPYIVLVPIQAWWAHSLACCMIIYLILVMNVFLAMPCYSCASHETKASVKKFINLSELS